MTEYFEYIFSYIQAWIPRLAALPLLLISIILHEVSHGFAAYLMGDPTAKRQGRLTLNPAKHLDLVGTICMLFAPFGWAKPVPINPYYMKKPKRGMAITALAGPLCNLILTVIGVVLYVVLIPYIYDKDWLVTAIIYFVQLNCTLAVFNLIPFPPLDGSKILFAILPEEKYFKYMQYERYGIIILMVLIFFGVFDRYISFVTGAIISFLLEIAIKIF